MLRGLIRQAIRLSAQQARMNRNIQRTKLRISQNEQQQKKRQEKIDMLHKKRLELLIRQPIRSMLDDTRPEEWQSY